MSKIKRQEGVYCSLGACKIRVHHFEKQSFRGGIAPMIRKSLFKLSPIFSPGTSATGSDCLVNYNRVHLLQCL